SWPRRRACRARGVGERRLRNRKGGRRGGSTWGSSCWIRLAVVARGTLPHEEGARKAVACAARSSCVGRARRIRDRRTAGARFRARRHSALLPSFDGGSGGVARIGAERELRRPA